VLPPSWWQHWIGFVARRRSALNEPNHRRRLLRVHMGTEAQQFDGRRGRAGSTVGKIVRDGAIVPAPLSSPAPSRLATASDRDGFTALLIRTLLSLPARLPRWIAHIGDRTQALSVRDSAGPHPILGFPPRRDRTRMRPSLSRKAISVWPCSLCSMSQNRAEATCASVLPDITQYLAEARAEGQETN